MKSESLNTLKERWKDGTFGDLLKDWKWIFSYSARFKLRIAAYIILGVLCTTLGLISALAVKFLLDVVISHKTDRLWLAALVTIGSSMLILAVNNLINRIHHRMDVDMSNIIRSDVFDSVMKAGWQSLNRFSNGDILSRLHGDIGTVSGNAIDWLPGVVNSVYSFVSTFFVIWFYSPTMSLIALSSAPVLLLMSRYLLRKQKAFRDEMMKANSKVYSFETEALYNIDTIKSFGVMGFFSLQLKDLQTTYRNISLSWNMFQIRTSIFMTLLNLLVGYVAYGYALYLLWGGRITYGTMTLFLQQSGALRGAFQNLVGLVPGFINGSVSAHRIQDLMALPEEKHLEQEIPREYFRGGLTLKMDHVDFAYENSGSVIEDSDFEAHPGQITVLVGPSGEGKTTVLRLILGIVEPTNGSCVFLSDNGPPLTAGVGSRALISYVPQGNTLLSGTIAENMRLARQDATDEEIMEALKLACAWEFVEKLPDGIHTQLYSQGKGLSEGQAQRVSIARALLRDAPVLLLDEATSALDVETERNVLKNILKKSPGRTCIVTSHRPTVLLMCNQVYRVVDRKITRLDDREINAFLRNF